MWPLAESFLRNPCAVHGQRSLHLNGATIHTIRHDVQVEPWLRIFYLAEARLGSATKYIRAISAIYVTVAPPGDSCQITPISLCSGLMHNLARRYAVDMLFSTLKYVLSLDWNSFRLSYTMDSIVMFWIFIYILAALMSTFDIYLLCWIDIPASLSYAWPFGRKIQVYTF